MTTPMPARAFAERVGDRSGHRLGEPQRMRVGRMLRIEALERELGEARRPPRPEPRPLDRREPAGDVVGLVGRCVLLDECDFHVLDFTLSSGV